MEHTNSFSWKVILGSLAAFALNGCASNAPQMSLLSDQDLCYQYLYIPTNDGRYDNYVYGEVEYRTHYEGLMGCDTFARGQANNIREASVQRFADYRQGVSNALRDYSDFVEQNAAAHQERLNPPTPTVKCVKSPVYFTVARHEPQPVVEFALQNCPRGYDEVN